MLLFQCFSFMTVLCHLMFHICAQSIKFYWIFIDPHLLLLPFNSASPTAARSQLERHCVSRLLSASRRGTVKYVETLEWRKGRNAILVYFITMMIHAALQNASSKAQHSAGKLAKIWIYRTYLACVKNFSDSCINWCLYSDRNSPCCKNCKFQSAGTRCQEPISATCKGMSYCTGDRLLLVWN